MGAGTRALTSIRWGAAALKPAPDPRLWPGARPGQANRAGRARQDGDRGCAWRCGPPTWPLASASGVVATRHGRPCPSPITLQRS